MRRGHSLCVRVCAFRATNREPGKKRRVVENETRKEIILNDRTATEETEKDSTVRQVSMLDLLALTTLFAVLFGVQELMIGKPGFLMPTKMPWNMIFRLEYTVLWGSSSVGIYLCLKHWYLSRKFARHPGYLLLFFLGVSSLLFLLLFLFSNAWYVYAYATHVLVEPSAVEFLVRLLIQIAAIAAPIGFLVYGCFRDHWWWRACFVALSWINLISFFQHIILQFYVRGNVPNLFFVAQMFGWLFAVGTTVGLALIVFCVVKDRTTNTKRDWIHWLGVLAYLFQSIVPAITSMIATRILSPSEWFGS